MFISSAKLNNYSYIKLDFATNMAVVANKVFNL